MTIIRPDSMPRFWWLVPWAYARQLHRNANALRALSDRLDDAVTLQERIIADQSKEIANLRAEADRHRHHIKCWLRALEENEALRKKGAGK
jgi:uncharacterized coiled-coil protein SlyX